IRLQAPAVEDRANEALRELLAGLLRRPKSGVRILAGERSRMERIEGFGGTPGGGGGVGRVGAEGVKIVFSWEKGRGIWRRAKLDGWLFYDFRGRDPIAHRILHLPNHMRTRRWFYFVPAKGTPKKLVHKIETQSLASLPGETLYYSGQEELRKNLKKILGR